MKDAIVGLLVWAGTISLFWLVPYSCERVARICGIKLGIYTPPEKRRPCVNTKPCWPKKTGGNGATCISLAVALCLFWTSCNQRESNQGQGEDSAAAQKATQAEVARIKAQAEAEQRRENLRRFRLQLAIAQGIEAREKEEKENQRWNQYQRETEHEELMFEQQEMNRELREQTDVQKHILREIEESEP